LALRLVVASKLVLLRLESKQMRLESASRLVLEVGVDNMQTRLAEAVGRLVQLAEAVGRLVRLAEAVGRLVRLVVGKADTEMMAARAEEELVREPVSVPVLELELVAQALVLDQNLAELVCHKPACMAVYLVQ
jgi:malonyl CoA-acyl carrier protein transacylase